MGYKAQKESKLQREIVEYLNGKKELNCFVFRMKNGATYDPIRNVFRSNTTTKGIPDIVGWAANGQIIFIEVKLLNNGKTTSVPSKEQKELLKKAAEKSPFVGVAYTVEDAYDIVANDKEQFPRNIRTFNYLNKGEKKAHERPDGTKKDKTKKIRGKERRLSDLCPWLPQPEPEPPKPADPVPAPTPDIKDF